MSDSSLSDMVSASFHFSFLVDDLEKADHFYATIMGARRGRFAPNWADYDFYGNQLSLHLGKPMITSMVGKVDDVLVPMPHFGVILNRLQFDILADNLIKHEIAFIIPPKIRYQGKIGEQITMFFQDPAGNAIEIKSFNKSSEIFSV